MAVEAASAAVAFMVEVSPATVVGGTSAAPILSAACVPRPDPLAAWVIPSIAASLTAPSCITDFAAGIAASTILPFATALGSAAAVGAGDIPGGALITILGGLGTRTTGGSTKIMIASIRSLMR